MNPVGGDEGQQGRRPTARPGLAVWLKRVRVVCIVVVAVLVLIVLFQNKERAAFDVLFWRLEAPQAVLLLGIFATGALVGAVATRLLRR